MPKGSSLPPFSPPSSTSNTRQIVLGGLVVLTILSLWSSSRYLLSTGSTLTVIPSNTQRILDDCAALYSLPGPPPNFAARDQSDRYVPGTQPTLITNATIWTGASGGKEVIHGGEIYIDKGIIKYVGKRVPETFVASRDHHVLRINAGRLWVTPAINDLHSHLGVDSSPELEGSSDTNSRNGIAQPWLRSLDGIDTHDEAYRLSISGGVATALVLPGSANAIGGQAFVIKLRETKERSPLSKVLEPPYSLLNGTHVDPSLPPRWRYIKHAAGENPSRVYHGTRMDSIWQFRVAYNEARKVKLAQDAYCAKARAGQWAGLPASLPESLQWEALVDVLRGRVKVNIHIYETVDFTSLVGLSNEFQFHVAAFHHAHEAYLVPDVLKQTYGGPPGVAIFATNARYKRESYRGSEFAAKLLHDQGLQVVMKSDHPVLNSRFLLYEAQQAHYYGLNDATALAAVTSTPAELAGLSHRIGYLKAGHDADLVIWDSHPLVLGATPHQVFIDGIPQLSKPFVLQKPPGFQAIPETPDFEKEASDAVQYDGLPPLKPTKRTDSAVTFVNVQSMWIKGSSGAVESLLVAQNGRPGVVVVRGGMIQCFGGATQCVASEQGDIIDLHGGSISPGLVSFGSGLGLVEIPPEVSTNDGYILDPISDTVPSLLKDVEIRAVDGLVFGGRNVLIAYRSGVTSAVAYPLFGGTFGGLSAAFSLGASHKLEENAVVQDVVAVHVGLTHLRNGLSISAQISALRKALSGGFSGDQEKWFKAVSEGKIPLVVDVDKADHIATLLTLKSEVDKASGKSLRLVLIRASEAHLLAKEIADAGVGVILIPARQFPGTWDQLRALPGPPLTPESAIGILWRHNVTLGLGITEEWEARNQRFDIAWAALEANGTLTKADAISLASSNIESLLDVEPQMDLVAYAGGDFSELSSKPVAIISPLRSYVDIL